MSGCDAFAAKEMSMKEMRIIEEQLIAAASKVNKTTDGAVRGWYHILRIL